MISRKELLKSMPNYRFRLVCEGIARFLVHLFFRLEYAGLENVPDVGPVILAANHTSMADPLAIHTALRPWVCWVAKSELFQSRLGSAFYSRLGCIPVDRNKTDMMAARGIFKALRGNQIVGMFPQGTRVPQNRINSVRPHGGTIHFAIKTGAAILPVAISGSFKLFHKVRIIYGQPWQLGLDPRKHYSASEINDLSLQLMQRIYVLAGIDYQLEMPGREE